MKLLDKKKIVEIKAKERQTEINEGIKLAKRIDSLREIQAEEEKSLAVFRNATLKKINDDIKEANTELSNIQRSIKDEKDAHIEYEQSLINRKVQLDEQEQLLCERWSLFHEERDKLDTCAKIIKQTSLDTEKDKIRVAGELEEAKRQRMDAEQLLAEAKDKLASANDRIVKAEEREQEVRQLFEHQSNYLLKWESDLNQKQRDINTQVTNITNRETLLRDQYIALEQAKIHVKQSLP
jgi:chromosome segregation ATPase